MADKHSQNKSIECEQELIVNSTEDFDWEFVGIDIGSEVTRPEKSASRKSRRSEIPRISLADVAKQRGIGRHN